MQPNFNPGDKTVYPAHGVADVVGVETKTIGQQSIAFYHLSVLGSGLKISVPVHKAEENGMRAVARDEEITELYALLRHQEIPSDRQTWNRRHRTFMEKIRTGSLFEVAEVYRDLSVLKAYKELSHGERQMLRTARSLLVNELAVARATSEDEVEAHLEAFFQN
ncbi:MAG: CarD family transcriptional regulator [Nannocystaceae bacterium]|nr:CarD family transcriptional regulator [Nannocystaceae bacterium]